MLALETAVTSESDSLVWIETMRSEALNGK